MSSVIMEGPAKFEQCLPSGVEVVTPGNINTTHMLNILSALSWPMSIDKYDNRFTGV
jgi:hypothetical protein